MPVRSMRADGALAVLLLLVALAFSSNALGDESYEADQGGGGVFIDDADDPPLLKAFADDSHAYEDLGYSKDCGCAECSPKQSCGSACRCDCTKFWVRGEYLMWWTSGMRIPPLVTTSDPGTPLGEQGVLGLSTTQILYGNENLFNTMRNGGRITLGYWFDDCQTCGIEADYFGLEDASTRFRRDCFENSILDRPFFNVDPTEMGGPQQDAEIVCAEGVLHGSVTVLAHSSFNGGGFRFRKNLRCCEMGCEEEFGCETRAAQQCRLDLLAGYRFLRLRDGLSIREELNSVAAPVTNFDLLDIFNTRSEFHGGEVGLVYSRRMSRFSVEMSGRVAIGSTRQVVQIDGRTRSSTGGTASERSGGLLAQTSNIGTFDQARFTLVPQLDLNVGYDLTPSVRLFAGYTWMMWSDVARAGDQIDLTVNALYLDPRLTFDGPERPSFDFKETSFWAQGVNLGLEIRL